MSSVSKPRVRQNRHKQGLNQTLEKISADFRISKFVVKKNKRQLVQGSFSLWGGCKTGVESDGEVSVTSRQIKEGVYDVIVKAKPGEYCFVFTNNGVGGYSSVFDFTIQ